MKGIILAGGSGTRLYPVTKGFSKQLLPIYDKPMIYYPLSVLMLAGIQDILIITSPDDQSIFKKLLGDGSNFGVNLNYRVQNSPNGLAEAFMIGEDFIGNDNVSLILGDNIFWGHGFTETLEKASSKPTGSKIFAYKVENPCHFGVVEFDDSNRVISIEEKPSKPKSNFAVTGLYFYDNDVISIAKSLRPSARGELEITAVNEEYLKQGSLSVELLGRGFAWLDTGTSESLLDASNFVSTIEKRQGFKIACLEEIAFNKNWIDKSDIEKIINNNSNNPYTQYLKNLII